MKKKCLKLHQIDKDLPQKGKQEDQGHTVPVATKNGFHTCQQGTQYYNNYVKTLKVLHQKNAMIQDKKAQLYHGQDSKQNKNSLIILRNTSTNVIVLLLKIRFVKIVREKTQHHF